MHSKASADLSYADELSHELRLLALQFGELVYDDEEVRNRSCYFSAFVQLGIGVYIIDAVLCEDPLPAPVLTLDGDHGTLDLVA